MKSKKNLRYLIIAVIVLIVIAIAGKQAGWFGKELEITVAVEKAQMRTIVEVITANGKIRPQTEVKISPDVSGEIVELHVAEGDRVEVGQLLAKIKPDTYISMRDRAEAAVNSSQAQLANSRARLAQVEAQLEQSERTYERNRRLYEQQTISDAEYEAARSSFRVATSEVEAASQSVQAAEFSVKSAMASLEEAEENLRKTTIYSPMSGTISALYVEQGERVVGTAQMTGTEMMRIANLNRMEVQVEVNENDIVRVKINDTAQIEIDAYMGEDFLGIVTEIANSANVANLGTDQITNFDVKILVLPESYLHLMPENPAGRYPLLPGMSATVDIQTMTRYDVLSVPIQSVTTRPDSVLVSDAIIESIPSSRQRTEVTEVVFKANNGETAEIVAVTTGIQDNEYIEILRGLSEGDVVVSAPYSAISRTLEHGNRINIVDQDDLYN